MNRKHTKRALCMSFVSLLLCCSMLVGSTFAWFTDTATTAVNKIESGKLDVDLEAATEWDNEGKPTAWESADKKTLDFVYAGENKLWEPGCTYKLPEIRVINNGNLYLKYQIAITGINGDAELNKAIVWTVNGDEMDLAAMSQYVSLAPGDTSDALTIQGHMREDAGNEYQGLTIDGIGITVFATQKDAEYDSFDNEYDKDAPTLISMNGTAYDTLAAALEVAETGAEITVGGTVEYDFGTASNQTVEAKNVVISGKEGAVIVFKGDGANNTFANATLKNVKIVDETTSYGEDSWELGYLELANITAEDVVFANGIMLDGTNSFTGCTFTGKTESMAMYGAWVNSGTATFTNCTFVGTRGLKVHEAYESEITNVTVDSCAFNGMTEKPGIALGDLKVDTTVTIKDSTFIDVQPGNQGEYIYESDTVVSTFTFTLENNTIDIEVAPGLRYNNVDTYTVMSAEGMFSFADQVNNKKNTFSGETVKLDADIDLENKAWTPIGQTGATQFLGTFDGNNKTIKNLKIDSSAQTGGTYSTGLFGWIERHGSDGNYLMAVKNLKVDGATVKGNHNVAVIAGYLIGTVENCHVTNATVTCNHANDDACGDKAGVIAGIAAESNALIKNCTASTSTVTAGRDAGQIVGACIVGKVENCSATNVTVSATGDCTGANVNDALIGRTN